MAVLHARSGDLVPRWSYRGSKRIYVKTKKNVSDKICTVSGYFSSWLYHTRTHAHTHARVYFAIHATTDTCGMTRAVVRHVFMNYTENK